MATGHLNENDPFGSSDPPIRSFYLCFFLVSLFEVKRDPTVRPALALEVCTSALASAKLFKTSGKKVGCGQATLNFFASKGAKRLCWIFDLIIWLSHKGWKLPDSRIWLAANGHWPRSRFSHLDGHLDRYCFEVKKLQTKMQNLWLFSSNNILKENLWDQGSQKAYEKKGKRTSKL